MLRHAVLLCVCMTSAGMISAAYACGGETDPASDEAEQNLQGAYERLKYMTEERMQDLRLICLTGGEGQGCQP